MLGRLRDLLEGVVMGSVAEGFEDWVFEVRREPAQCAVDDEAEPDYEAIREQVSGLAQDVRGWTLAVQVAEAERAHAIFLLDAANGRIRNAGRELAAARAEFEAAVTA